MNEEKTLEELLANLSKNVATINEWREKQNSNELDDILKDFDLYAKELDAGKMENAYISNIRMTTAAKLMHISMQNVVDNSRMIGDILYYKNPKTGEAIIVGDDENVLYADDTIPWISHLEAYEMGNRTPIECFEESEG